MRNTRLLFVLFTAALVAACKDSTDPPRIEALEIVPSPANVQINRTLQLQAIPLGGNGDTIRGRSASWTILDENIATLSSAGVLTGVAAGTTSVVASAGGVQDTAMVIVSGFNASGTLSDDFTSYPDTRAFLSNTGRYGLYPVVDNITLAEIDPNVRYNGHQTLRMSQPAGTSEDLVLFVYLPEAVGNFWFRTKARFSPGWQPSTGTNGGVDTFLHWGWSGGVTQRGEINIQPERRYELSWFASGATARAFTDAGEVGTEWSDGQWMDVIVHYERLSNTSTRTRLWMAPDGQTPVLRATVEGTMASGSAPLVDRVRISPEYRWPLAAPQAVWLGQWEIVNGAQVANPFGVAP